MKDIHLGRLTTASPWIYDLSQRLIGFNYRFIKKQLKQWNGLQPGSTCLDIGCGVGSLQPFIRENGLHYLGVDINRNYIEYAGSRYGSCFKILDARQLSQLDQQFDVALSVGLFHHLHDEDCLRVLSETNRVLKNGARYFILDAIPAQPNNRVGIYLRSQDAGGYLRKIDAWTVLFSRYFTIEKSMSCARWPYDYAVFYLCKEKISL